VVPVTPRRKFGLASLAVLLAVVVTGAASCGGGGGGNNSGTVQIGSASVQSDTDKDGFVAAKGTFTFTPTVSETVTASYAGDTNYRSSSVSVAITVQ
jgi:hypothetical protein